MEEVEHDCLCSCPTLCLHNELLCSLLLSPNGAGRDGAEDGVGHDHGHVEDGSSGFMRVRDKPPSLLLWRFNGVEEGQGG